MNWSFLWCQGYWRNPIWYGASLLSITKWWFNLNWSNLLWRRVKLPQMEASAYYLQEEFLPQAVYHSAGNLELHSSPVSSSYSSRGSVSPQGTHSASTGSSPTLSKKIHQMIIIEHEEILWIIFLHLLNQLLYELIFFHTFIQIFISFKSFVFIPIPDLHCL